jgi:hypothetical protein
VKRSNAKPATLEVGGSDRKLEATLISMAIYTIENMLQRTTFYTEEFDLRNNSIKQRMQ